MQQFFLFFLKKSKFFSFFLLTFFSLLLLWLIIEVNNMKLTILVTRLFQSEKIPFKRTKVDTGLYRYEAEDFMIHVHNIYNNISSADPKRLPQSFQEQLSSHYSEETLRRSA